MAHRAAFTNGILRWTVTVLVIEYGDVYGRPVVRSMRLGQLKRIQRSKRRWRLSTRTPGARKLFAQLRERSTTGP